MAIVELDPAVLSSADAALSEESLRSLFSWRTVKGFRRAEGFVLAVFFMIAAYTLRYHEPWDDEAQAWLIARDNSAWQIVRHRLHYEGAPPAWHLLLHLFHVAGGTYAGIGWLGIILATAGVYVWLRWSPFPLFIRFLLPFTFFFQYQYAVIARSYILFPLLTFGLCVLFTKKRSVLWFALIAGTLANVSLQGFAEAFAFVALYIFEAYRKGALRSSVVDSEKLIETASPSRRRYIFSTVLFCVMASVAIYSAIPAPDLDFAIGDQVSTGRVHQILVRLIGETPRNASRPVAEEPIALPKEAPTNPSWKAEPRAWLARMIYPQGPPVNHYAVRWLLRTVGPNLLDFVDCVAWPLANSNLLAFAFLFAVVLWLRARRRLLMLLPWLTLMAVGQVLWTAEHHAGMLLIALIAGLWLAADTARKSPSFSADRLLFGLFTPILLLQILWSIHCIRADVRASYDPGPETARWLQANAKPRMAAFSFATVSIQPWFSHSPFFDVPTSWWQWSSNVQVDSIHNQIIASHPDLVVYGLEFPGDGQIRDQSLPLSHISPGDERDLPGDLIVKDLHDHGYRETHRFCGTRFARFRSAYRICDMVFEPKP